MTDEAVRLWRTWLRDEIELDEFEHRLEGLDIGECGDPMPWEHDGFSLASLTDAPGQIIAYEPPSLARVDAVFREIYLS